MNFSDATPSPVWAHALHIPLRQMQAPMTVDVVVVGMGIAGLSAAYMLAKDGCRIALLDKSAPLDGMTARSTSHISTAIDDGWREAVPRLGIETASLAANAYRHGIKTIEQIVADEGIDCDFARVNGYLTGQQSDHDKLAAEYDAAKKVGIDVTWADTSPLATHVAAHTLMFPHQARLHPIKYAEGLARALIAAGADFIGTEMLQFTPGAHVGVQTTAGFDITATRALVIATNGSISLRGVSNKQARMRSYVIAARIDPSHALDAVTWDLEDPYHYTRLHPVDHAGRALLLVGGEDHPAHITVNERLRFQRLEAWARKAYPHLGEVEARWSGELQRTVDNLGLLGRHDNHANVFVIDGDGGLGFNHATIGAHIVCAELANKPCAWAHVFKPTRKPGVRPLNWKADET